LSNSAFHLVGIARVQDEQPGDACTKKASSTKEKKVHIAEQAIERVYRLAQNSEAVSFTVQGGRR
jgi:hypothetical protein